MDALSSRLNGQVGYRPAVQARTAWREEMLDQLLNQMREQKLPEEALAPVRKSAPLPGKGTFIDVYA